MIAAQHLRELKKKTVPQMNMAFWKAEFRQQFKWLKDTRKYLYRKISVGLHKKVLEPGCANALITEELTKRNNGIVVGLDKDLNILLNAKKRKKNLLLVCGDVYHLPFHKETFDSIIFEFFLLWLKKPSLAINEMKRTATPAGWIITSGEPDYGGRIDFPHTLNYTPFIIDKLSAEGADPFIGRKLEYLYRQTSLEEIEWNVASIPFGTSLSERYFEKEWNFIRKLTHFQMSQELKMIKKMERRFLKQGKRSYFMPVFYCLGRKKRTVKI